MSELINLKVKSKTGQITDIQVAEIIEIDGMPYQPAEDIDTIKTLLNHQSGRLAALEQIVGQMTAVREEQFVRVPE